MATIKSYSDLRQSKKLAKILPLETADMHSEAVDDEGNMVFIVVDGLGDKTKSNYGSPVWSLASLINVLPRSIEFKGDKYYLRFMKEYVEYANDEISITGRCLHTTGNNNLVDACYEMILKLCELNLLLL